MAIRHKLAEANPTATEFQSDVANSHLGIGFLLTKTGKLAEALKAYESALAILHKLAEANPTVTKFQSELAAVHNAIGTLLNDTGKQAEASQAHESALAIEQELARNQPSSPDFARYVGATLDDLATIDLHAKRFQEARVRLREAIEWQRKRRGLQSHADPTYRRFLANHFTNLIEADRGLGDSKGVAEAERDLAELRSSDPAMVALDARLSAIVRGDHQPTDNRERLQLAQRAYDKALDAAAAKLWADALDAEPKLAEDRQAQHRYNAACAAALAGCGQGKDGTAPYDALKAKLREQARGWLDAWRAGRLDKGRRIPHAPSGAFRRHRTLESTGGKTSTWLASARRKHWRPCPRPNARPAERCGRASTLTLLTKSQLSPASLLGRGDYRIPNNGGVIRNTAN